MLMVSERRAERNDNQNDTDTHTSLIQGLDEISRMEGVYVHLYGKKESKPKRKMGHITVLGDTPMDAHEKALYIQSKVGIVKG